MAIRTAEQVTDIEGLAQLALSPEDILVGMAVAVYRHEYVPACLDSGLMVAKRKQRENDSSDPLFTGMVIDVTKNADAYLRPSSEKLNEPISVVRIGLNVLFNFHEEMPVYIQHGKSRRKLRSRTVRDEVPSLITDNRFFAID